MKTTQGLAASLGMALAAVLGLSRFAASGTIDAVSGSSIKVTGGTTTTTGATINITFGHSGGTRRCYYDVADHTAITGFTKFASASGNTFTLSGLTAGTSYYYWIQITQSGEKTASFHPTTTIKTDGASSVLRRIPESAGNRSYVDPLGRRIGQQRGSAPVRISPDGAGIRIEPTAP
jgi:hypothetical protein